jgi:hypothetical protein
MEIRLKTAVKSADCISEIEKIYLVMSVILIPFSPVHWVRQ